jgi:hypothetical protein
VDIARTDRLLGVSVRSEYLSVCLAVCMGYVLFMFTHRAHACERGCAIARVVKHSLIFGRILLKFAGHILQMTTSYMGYILIIFTHRAHACLRAPA